MKNQLMAAVVAALVGLATWVLLPEGSTPPPSPQPVTSTTRPSRRPRVEGPSRPAMAPGAVRTLTFKVVTGDAARARDLPLTVSSRCGPRLEGHTTDAGVLELPEVGRCELSLALGVSDLTWELFDDDTVELVQGGDVTVHVTDEHGSPVASATVTGRSDHVAADSERRHPRPFGCTTDGAGRCGLRWPTGQGAWLTLEAAGFARSTVQASFSPTLELTLRPQRPLTIVVDGNGAPFMPKTRLVVWASDFRFEQPLTGPATVEVEHLPAGVEFSAGVRVGSSGLGKLTVDAGVEPIAVRLQLPPARRLEVFATFDPDPELAEDADEQPLVRANVDATCGQRHLAAAFGPRLPDGRHRAVIDYAPEGPCLLTASTWDRRQTFEVVKVTPPASLTLRHAR